CRNRPSQHRHRLVPRHMLHLLRRRCLCQDRQGCDGDPEGRKTHVAWIPPPATLAERSSQSSATNGRRHHVLLGSSTGRGAGADLSEASKIPAPISTIPNAW